MVLKLLELDNSCWSFVTPLECKIGLRQPRVWVEKMTTFFDVLIFVDKKIVIFYVENFCKIQLQVLS